METPFHALYEDHEVIGTESRNSLMA